MGTISSPPTMSTLYTSPDGREMLDLVDKLRSIDRIEKTVPLPQIVVVGQQSCGKSSVLHAISGIQFPTADGRCTQFPTEIILRRENTTSTKAYIRFSTKIPAQRKIDFERFAQDWSTTSLAKLKEIMIDAKAVLKLDKTKYFCQESLVLEVSGPEQEHLTLIDLPGFFVSTQVNQSQSDITLVDDIARHYMSKERTIVLAVISGKTDLENQKVLEVLKEDRQLCSRTMGVITGPDRIGRETRLEQECMDFLREDPRGLGYGWHTVRNLSHEEVQSGNSDRDGKERQFFQLVEPWARLDNTKRGSQALKTRLSSVLKQVIAQSVPDIKQEVDGRLREIDARLKALGTPRTSPRKIRRFLCETATQFSQKVTLMLSGAPPKVTCRTLAHRQSLRSFIQNQYTLFADDLYDRARLWKSVDEGTVSPRSDFHIIYDGGMSGTEVVAVPDIIKHLIRESRQHCGKGLPNLPDPDLASRIFRLQSQRWETIAKYHCDIIFQAVQDRMIQAIEENSDETTADRLLRMVVEPALRKRKETLDGKLEELYRPHTLPGIQCFSRRYLASTDQMAANGTGSASVYDQCFNFLWSAEAYYDIACDVFLENVANLGIENCLIAELQNILSPEEFSELDEDELNTLGGELAIVKEERDRLALEREQLKEVYD